MRFQPGQSGNPNGRPKGARNKLSETFLKALANDFEAHGIAVIEKVREELGRWRFACLSEWKLNAVRSSGPMVSSKYLDFAGLFAFDPQPGRITMSDDAFTRQRTIRLMLALAAALSLWPLYPKHASAEGPDEGADLAARFQSLSQHGNVECSAQFEKSIATMPPDAKLQGSCCAPMDETRYRQQIEGLRKYADIPSRRIGLRSPT